MECIGHHSPPPPAETGDTPPLRSERSQDADLAELLELFINDLPDRIAEIQIALRRDDLTQMIQLVRQFRTAARGYGFPDMIEPAARIEALTRHACDIRLVHDAVDELLTLMRRARGARNE